MVAWSPAEMQSSISVVYRTSLDEIKHLNYCKFVEPFPSIYLGYVREMY